MEKVVPESDAWIAEFRRGDVIGEDPFQLGAWMEFGFERIHPFSDGNGRVGRLMLNLHFLRRNWPPIHFSPLVRNRYVLALESEHDRDLSPLSNLLMEPMAASLLDILDQVGVEADRRMPLRAFENDDLTAKHLSLRAGQGFLPAVKVKGEYRTSARAIDLYRRYHGRK